MPKQDDFSGIEKVTFFSNEELKELQVSESYIEYFILSEKERGKVASDYVGNSVAERKPFEKVQDGIALFLPTAISVSIRYFVLEIFHQFNCFEQFSSSLHQNQYGMLFDNARSNLKIEPIEFKPNSELKPTSIKSGHYLGRFDKGKYCLIVFVFRDIGKCREEAITSHEVFNQQDIENFSSNFVSLGNEISSFSGFEDGYVFVVSGGVGRGMSIPIKSIPRKWEFASLALPDFLTLSRTRNVDMRKLWQLSKQESLCERLGIEILNLNGFINLFAFWQQNGFRLFPKDLDISRKNLLHIATNFVSSLRLQVRKKANIHSCFKKSDGWVTVERYLQSAYFKSDEFEPVYDSKDLLYDGVLYGVVESKAANIGVTLTESTTQITDIVYRLWECLLNWTHQISQEIDKRKISLHSNSLEIQFLMSAKPDVSDVKAIESSPDTPNATINKKDIIVFEVCDAYLSEFGQPKNIAERKMVYALTNCILKNDGRQNHDSLAKSITESVVPNEDARYVHMTRTYDFRKIVLRTFQPEPLLISESSKMMAEVEFALRLPNKPQSESVQGIKACKLFLKNAVGEAWQRLEEKLSNHSLEAVVRGCVNNLEILSLDKEHWEMTSRAMRGLRNNEHEFKEVYLKRESDRNLSSITTRAVLETALYSCKFSNTDDEISSSDLEELLAIAEILILLANHRIALDYGFIEPTISFHPSGEFTLDLSFYTNIVYKYLTSTMVEGITASVEGYEHYYSEKAKPARSEESFQDFDEMFNAEFGFSVESLFQFSGELKNHYMKDKIAFNVLDYDDFLKIFKNNPKVNEGVLNRILTQFSLYPRSSWSKDLPSHCTQNQVFPWKFMRRFSILARPIIRLTDELKGRYFIAPAMIDDCFSYFVNNLDKALYPSEGLQTDAAKKYCGKIKDNRGKQFEFQVKEVFEGLNYTAERGVKMKRFSPPQEKGDLGDLDVLAWNETKREIFLIECKHLQRDMSLEDIVERLNEYKGESSDPLGKHIRRTDWLLANKDKIFELLKLSHGESYSVQRLLVTNVVVPIQFSSSLPIPFSEIVPIDRLESSLAKS